MYILICRIYQLLTRALSALMPWREPLLLQGEHSVLQLPEMLKQDGVVRPLFITGPTVSRLGLAQPLLAALQGAGIQAPVFDRTQNDPTVANVEEAVACYLENRCDGIIAFGGGSPMDCAKLCGARVARPDRTVAQLRGMLRVRKPIPPLYAVPTTAGTGSEVTLAAVVTGEGDRKYAVGDFALIPRAAVLDATLTLGLPGGVTAASGMDALCHAVEAYIGHSNTPATRQNAKEAVRLVFTELPTACADGGNLAARSGMQLAAYRAGLAFTRANVGYAHAVAHAVGGRYHLAHGLCCAIALPAVLRAYGQPAHRALAELAQAVGAGVAGQSEAAQAEAFIAAISGLSASVGLPSRYLPMVAEDIPMLARQAADEGNLFYPAPKVLTQPMLRDVLLALAPIE